MRQWIRMGACALTLLGGAAFAGGSAPPKLAGLGGPPLEVEEIEEPEEEIKVYEPPQEEVQEPVEGAQEVEEYQTEEVQVSEKKEGMNPGPYVLIGGGVDGFSGGLASDVNPGFAWGATAGVMAPRLGLELGYSGSVNEVDRDIGFSDEGAGSGADIVRNGGQAAVTVNLLTSKLHPYLLGGIGLENYNVRNGQAAGFEDDTSGYVPTGAGLRWNISRVLTADARFTYNFLFSDEFAPENVGGNRYQGLLTLGGTY